MKKLLIIFVNRFPFYNSEPFLEKEHLYYKEQFDKVLLVTNCKKGDKPTRTISDSRIEIIEDYTMSGDIKSILQALPLTLTDSIFYKELLNLLRYKKVSPKALYDTFVLSLCANHRALLVSKYLKKHPEYKPGIIYSTWLQIPAYAAILLNRRLNNKCYTISRAHGFDVYSERHKTGYIPYHHRLYVELDEISTISSDGKKYLENKYGNFNKVVVRRLGASDLNKINPDIDRDCIRLVSCSRVIPLKRLEKIADALGQIKDRPIHWTHLGGGDGLKKLITYTQKKVGENVTVDFTGNISNNQVYETYSTVPFHAFLNVSESEGIPVSIMEAMSFGIPVIATDVGGTAELVDCECGFLLNADFSDDELIEAIKGIPAMPENEYLLLRRNARTKFENEYSASTNYSKFVEHLSLKSKI